MKTERGRLIALEGADGAGTTTQARRLASALEARGLTVHTTCEPSPGPVGRLIRERLKAGIDDDDGWRALALLFAADRLDHLAREIEPQLASGAWVITDRFTLSSLVYQSLHVDTAWVRELNRFAAPADAVVLVTVPLDVAMARIASRGGDAEAYDQRGLQARIHALYDAQGAAERAIRVEGDAPEDVVETRIVEALAARGLL